MKNIFSFSSVFFKYYVQVLIEKLLENRNVLREQTHSNMLRNTNLKKQKAIFENWKQTTPYSTLLSSLCYGDTQKQPNHISLGVSFTNKSYAMLKIKNENFDTSMFWFFFKRFRMCSLFHRKCAFSSTWINHINILSFTHHNINILQHMIQHSIVKMPQSIKLLNHFIYLFQNKKFACSQNHLWYHGCPCKWAF